MLYQYFNSYSLSIHYKHFTEQE